MNVPRSVALVLTAVALVAAPARVASAAGAGTAVIEWSRPDRFVDVDGDPVPMTTSQEVAAPFTVTMDGCRSQVPGASSYMWIIRDAANALVTSWSAGVCASNVDIATQGNYTAELTVTGSGGTVQTSAPFYVKDYLIAAMGDSVASGEGNPISTIYSNDTGDPSNPLQLKLAIGAHWIHYACDRSTYSGHAQAAKWLETTDVHSSVSFVDVACSGSGIRDPKPTDDNDEGGLIDSYKGIHPFTPAMPPQIDQVKTLVGNRPIDAVLLSTGANNIHFSEIVKDCFTTVSVAGQRCNNGTSAGATVFNDRLPMMTGLYDELAARFNTVFGSQLPPSHVYITEYFDPTRCDDGQPCDLVPGLVDSTEAEWASNTVLAGLNGDVKAAASEHGWTLVDGIASAFRGAPGHGYAARARWIVNLEESIFTQADQNGSFHPNRTGHSLIRNRILAKLLPALDPTRRAPTDLVASVRPTGIPNLHIDSDGDTIPDGFDNCVTMSNIFQTDQDKDNIGDGCGFVVDDGAYLHDFTGVDGECKTLGGQCTLLAAIEQVNYDAQQYRVDHPSGRPPRRTVTFKGGGGGINLGGVLAGISKIDETGELPGIEGPIVFDGYSVPAGLGFSYIGMRCQAFVQRPCITLQATGRGAGLRFISGSDGSTVAGLNIQGAQHQIDIYTQASDAPNNPATTVMASTLGTDFSGVSANPYSKVGVFVDGTPNVLIGSPDFRDHNVISGNSTAGVFINGASSNTIVLNNQIGTNWDGDHAVPNGDGIYLDAATDVGVGANTISGNTGNGIVTVAGSDDNNFEQNLIGTDTGGTGAIPNGGYGIKLSGGSNNKVGGVDPTERNTIAYNGLGGVQLKAGNGNRIQRNAIYDNRSDAIPDALGIDISSGGALVTENDPGDTDNWPNHGQNFPEWTSVTVHSPTSLDASGTLDSAPRTVYEIELFANPACEPSRHGEGRRYLTTVTVATNDAGHATFATTVDDVDPGTVLTATATDFNTHDTSEFSLGWSGSGTCSSIYVVNSPNDLPDGSLADDVCDTGTPGHLTGDCTLRAALQQANSHVGLDTINFAIGIGAAAITPLSALPNVTERVLIDASTQPGYTGEAPRVEVHANGVGSGPTALRIMAPDVTVRALAITGFVGNGLEILAAAARTRIYGCWIGVALDGTKRANTGDGLLVNGQDVRVGGSFGVHDGNVISGNTGSGVRIANPQATLGAQIVHNRIGTTPDGTAALANGGNGIVDGSPFTVFDLNVVSGNAHAGISISSPGAVLTWNKIGTTADGMSALGNGGVGLDVTRAVTIGKNTEGNVVSGNALDGIRLSGDVAGTTLVENMIGTDKFGLEPIGNGGNGVTLNSSNVTIGSTDPYQRNIISANGGHGIAISGAATTGIVIQGNHIGTDDDGVAPLGNGENGVDVSSAHDITIGADDAAHANIIAANAGDGVHLNATSGVMVTANEFFGNAGMAVDLVPDGPTPNDPGDVDTGADALQNFTTVRSATTGLARSVVFGDLNSLPSRYYRVDIYMADDCDPRGQGSVWLGTVREWVNPSGLGSFSFTRQSALPPGANITFLTTDLTSQNTSEFSPCRAVASDVSVGTVGLSAFASTTSLSTQLTLHWTPPGGGDIDNYDIDVRRAPWNGGFGAWASWKRGIHGTSATYTGKTSNSYCFRVRAHDLVGNTSAWSSSRCVGIPIPASSIPHGSPWTVNVRSQAFGDRLLRTTSLRAKLTRTSIVAHAIGVVATKCHGCGAIAITWNGTRVAVFSLEASSTTYQRVLIAKSWSTAQHGTLGIEVTTSGKPVLIEGIVVYQH